MGSRLLVGVPATAVLFLVTWTAMRRTRREERALAQAREEMRRREIAEEALRQSQRLEAVGQLTGGVAHDFNNLLTVVVGNLEMIARRAEDAARVRRLAGNALLAAKRGAEVTHTLLAFSRRQMIRPETVDLNRRLREFQSLLQRGAGETVRVELDLDDGLDPVRLDPGQFESAILNLVVNARDAMPGSGRLVIATRNATVVGASEASGRRRAPTFASPCPTRAWAWTRRRRQRPSSRSSRPRRSAREPAWA
jgi:signal transduction histidine kinase